LNNKYIQVNNSSLMFAAADGKPVLALDDVSLVVPEGQFLAIVGPSGLATEVAPLLSL
jgi:ABC-type oligopeptide transport system ATPase subunit